MLKRKITYTNPFTDQKVIEDHYFHISKADLIEMQMENLNESEVSDPETGEKLEGYRAMLQRVINDKDGKTIMVIVKDMVRRSYGKKQGDRFVRSPEIWADFESSEAWSQLYFELCTDAEAQAAFMNGIFPGELLAEANAVLATQTAPSSTVPAIAAYDKAAETLGAPNTSEIADPIADPTGLSNSVTPQVLTSAEVMAMDGDELKSGLATGKYKLS